MKRKEPHDGSDLQDRALQPSAKRQKTEETASDNSTLVKPAPEIQDGVLLNPYTYVIGERAAAGKERAPTEQAQGTLITKVVTNDGTPENLIYLMSLKRIFCDMLPNMPRDYIVRLVFCKKHKAVCVIRKDPDGKETVVGGIHYRPFYEQGFTEIVFCAVSEDEQRKGYGAYIMSQLKLQSNKEKIYHFLTYADDDAITYFKKQGFTTDIDLDRKYWGGYIKDYVGATPMHCKLQPSDKYYEEYVAMPAIIKEQRKALQAKVRELSLSHLTYKGFSEFKTSDVSRIAVDRLQVLLDRGWDPARYAVMTSPELQRRIHMINSEFVARFKADNDSWPFRQPVDVAVAPDYYEKVKDPIDISLIEKRLQKGNYYISQEMLVADLKRMMNTCKEYNGADSDYSAIAIRLEKKYLERWRPVPL